MAAWFSHGRRHSAANRFNLISVFLQCAEQVLIFVLSFISPVDDGLVLYTVKPVFFACPLFRDPDEFAKITGREYILAAVY